MLWNVFKYRRLLSHAALFSWKLRLITVERQAGNVNVWHAASKSQDWIKHIFVFYFMMLPLTQLYRRIIGRRMFDELKIKKDVQWNGSGITEILFRILPKGIECRMKNISVRIWTEYIPNSRPRFCAMLSSSISGSLAV